MVGGHGAGRAIGASSGLETTGICHGSHMVVALVF
jgi:hypothetical protein